MCDCTSENLEIPGPVLTHHPGMTEGASPMLAMTDSLYYHPDPA
jgi:hypothetical protein